MNPPDQSWEYTIEIESYTKPLITGAGENCPVKYVKKQYYSTKNLNEI